MKVELNNGQSGAPYLSVNIGHKAYQEVLRVYFCKDGAIIKLPNQDKSVGIEYGARGKNEQCYYEKNMPKKDGILLGEI